MKSPNKLQDDDSYIARVFLSRVLRQTATWARSVAERCAVVIPRLRAASDRGVDTSRLMERVQIAQMQAICLTQPITALLRLQTELSAGKERPDAVKVFEAGMCSLALYATYVGAQAVHFSSEFLKLPAECTAAVAEILWEGRWLSADSPFAYVHAAAAKQKGLGDAGGRLAKADALRYADELTPSTVAALICGDGLRDIIARLDLERAFRNAGLDETATMEALVRYEQAGGRYSLMEIAAGVSEKAGTEFDTADAKAARARIRQVWDVLRQYLDSYLKPGEPRHRR